MRVLILGTTKSTTTKLGELCKSTIDTGTEKWTVVSSLTVCRKLWDKCDNIKEVVEPSNTSLTLPNNNFILDRVLSPIFYSDNHNVQMIGESKNMIIMCSSPISYIKKEILTTFDKILISKTVGVDKLSQYHTLFADVTKCSFDDFKTKLKPLKDHTYMVIDPSTGELSSPFTAVEEKGNDKSLDESKKDTLKPPSEVEAITSALSNMSMDVKNIPKLKDTDVEVWAALYFNSLKGEPTSEKTKSVDHFKKILGNTLIRSMTSYGSYEDRDDSCLFYFQVREVRHDIFIALLSNILGSLKSSGMISRGCFFV